MSPTTPPRARVHVLSRVGLDHTQATTVGTLGPWRDVAWSALPRVTKPGSFLLVRLPTREHARPAASFADLALERLHDLMHALEYGRNAPALGLWRLAMHADAWARLDRGLCNLLPHAAVALGAVSRSMALLRGDMLAYWQHVAPSAPHAESQALASAVSVSRHQLEGSACALLQALGDELDALEGWWGKSFVLGDDVATAKARLRLLPNRPVRVAWRAALEADALCTPLRAPAQHYALIRRAFPDKAQRAEQALDHFASAP